jgi:hypothetical protein
MKTVNTIVLKFIKDEFAKAQVEITESNRVGVDFLINPKGTSYELFVQSINLDKEQSIKIPKQDLGELNDYLLIGLVLLIESEARVLYLIPSKDLLQSDNNIFINNEVSLIPSLSNWEIKVFSKGLEQLEIYTISNQIEKLR